MRQKKKKQDEISELKRERGWTDLIWILKKEVEIWVTEMEKGVLRLILPRETKR